MIIPAVSAWCALAIPLWYYTLTIYRAPLDSKAMARFEDIDNMIQTTVPIYLYGSTETPDLVAATQMMLDQRLADDGISGWRIAVYDGASEPHPTGLEVHVDVEDADTYYISENDQKVEIWYSMTTLADGRVPDLVAGILLDAVYGPELEWLSGDRALANHVVGYSPAYHLTFSLFHGGGEPLSWDIEGALDRFEPLRAALQANVANLTVDTQLEYYADLGSQPHRDNASGKHLLYKPDLSTLVNFAEWSLASSVDYPTLNFVLYIPSPDQTPLEIETSRSNSFLVPQWGGVAIVNELGPDRRLDAAALAPVMDIFASQLLALLGASPEPQSVPVRLETLARISTTRALRAAAASLSLLDRLAKNMPQIAIPEGVKTLSDRALAALDASLAAFRASNWGLAVSLAGHALVDAERAFFDKHMVAQAFFPDEHKLAVYMPLLGPIIVVLLSGWLRLLQRRKLSPEILQELAAADAAATESKIQVEAGTVAGTVAGTDVASADSKKTKEPAEPGRDKPAVAETSG